MFICLIIESLLLAFTGGEVRQGTLGQKAEPGALHTGYVRQTASGWRP